MMFFYHFANLECDEPNYDTRMIFGNTYLHGEGGPLMKIKHVYFDYFGYARGYI